MIHQGSLHQHVINKMFYEAYRELFVSNYFSLKYDMSSVKMSLLFQLYLCARTLF